MLTPALEIIVFLSATFLLGLALGWVLWFLSAKQEIGAIASERDFWKGSYEKARMQSEANQDFESPQDWKRKRARSA